MKLALISIENSTSRVFRFLTTFIVFFLLQFVASNQLLAQSTIRTIASGDWSAASTWFNNQIPTGGSGSITNPVAFGHNVTVTGDVTIANGVYFYGVNGAVAGLPISNTNVNDPAGLPYRKLNLIRATGNFNENTGILDVKSGTTNNFEGGADVDKNSLIVRTGAKLILGPLFCSACDPQTWDTEGLNQAQKDERRDKCLNIGGADVANEYVDCRQRRLFVTGNSQVIIEEGAEILVYGNVENKSNPGFVSLNGILRIIGNYAATVGNTSITQDVPGVGDIITTGSMTTQGNSTIFGSKNINCTENCVGTSLACSELIPGGFSISPSGVLAYCDPITLSVNPNPVVPTAGTVSYQWEYSNDLNFPFNTENRIIISGATNPTHLVDTITVTGLYRIRVEVTGGGECTAFSTPVVIDQATRGWIGAPNGLWDVPANWCGGIPDGTTDVVIPTGASPIVPTGYTALVRTLTLQGTSTTDLGAIVTIQSGATMNIHGNLLLEFDSHSADFANTNSSKIVNNGTVNFLGEPAVIDNVGKFLNEVGSTVNFNGETDILDIGFVYPNEFKFHDLNLSVGKTLSLADTDFEVTGDVTLVGDLDPQSSKIIFNGNTNQIIDANNNSFYRVEIDKSGGFVDLSSILNLTGRLDITSATVLISDGLLKLNSNNTLANTENSTAFDASIGPLLNGGSISGDVVVNRYIIPLPSGGNRLPFRYISTPVIDATWTGGSLAKYNIVSGTLPTYTVGSGGWKAHNLINPLKNGEGYRLSARDGADLEFTGQIASGEITWTFTNTTGAWFMIGNPYPSAIAWLNDGGSTRWEMTNVSSVIGIYDNFNEDYPNYFRYAFMEIPVDGIPPAQWGFEAEQNVIATGQSFWVYVGAGGGSLTIKENAKVNENEIGRFYRKDNSPVSNDLVIALSNTESRDIAVLSSPVVGKQRTAQRFANLPKLRNEEINIYLIDDSKEALLRYQLAEKEEEIHIPIGIEVAVPGVYTISFKNAENFNNKNFYLIDSYDGNSMELSSSSAYTFRVYNAPGTINDRFYLSTSPVINRAEEIHIYAYPNPLTDVLHLRTQGADETAQSSLVDSSGKTIDTATWKAEHTIQMSQYPSGIYILKVRTLRGVVNRKIIKQ